MDFMKKLPRAINTDVLHVATVHSKNVYGEFLTEQITPSESTGSIVTWNKISSLENPRLLPKNSLENKFGEQIKLRNGAANFSMTESRMQLRHRKVINILSNKAKNNNNSLVDLASDGNIKTGKISINNEFSPKLESLVIHNMDAPRNQIYEEKTVCAIAMKAIKIHQAERNKNLKSAPGLTP